MASVLLLNMRCVTLGEGNGTPLQYSCLENPMDGRAWWAAVHGVAKSQTQLSDLTFTFHFHALEKEKATHSSVLAWRIPGMAEPGGLPSMGSHRLGHDWSDLAVAAAAYQVFKLNTESFVFVYLLKNHFRSFSSFALSTFEINILISIKIFLYWLRSHQSFPIWD